MPGSRSATLSIALLALSAPAGAHAFECSKAGMNATITQVWQSRCIPYAINSDSSTLFSGAEAKLLVKQSFDQWASANNACTDLTFKDVGSTTQLGDFSAFPDQAADERNTIAAVEDSRQVDQYFGDPHLLAITLTHFFQPTGEILDADILLNSKTFNFDDITDPVACRGGSMAFDLRNTLVHELGHLIGFDHVRVESATMFFSADACETNKRDLDQDDKDGLCTVYPKGLPSQTCVPPQSYAPSGIDPSPWRNPCDRQIGGDQDPGGCSCRTRAAATDHGARAFWLLAVVALVARVRASGRRSARPLRRS